MSNKGAYISPSINDPALRDSLQSFADEIEASGITIADVDPDASLKARGGRLYYNATSSNLFIFSEQTNNFQPVSQGGEEKAYHAIRIYWPNTTTPYPGSDPQVTLTWANLNQASPGARWKGGLALPTVNGTPWQEDPPATISNSQNTVWWSDVVFQRTGSEATTTATGTTPQKHTNFDGLVTFTNNSYVTGPQVNNNVTSISGGVIQTGFISADRIDVNVLSYKKLKNNDEDRVTHLAGGPTSLVTLNNSTAAHTKSIFPHYGEEINVHALAVSHIYGSANSSSTATLNWKLKNYAGTTLATGTGTNNTGSHLLGGNPMAITATVSAANNPQYLSSGLGNIIMEVTFSGVSGITNNPRVQTNFIMWANMR